MENRDHRIVFVSGGIQLGGATTFLLNLAGELVRRDVPVLVISLERDNPYADDFTRRGIPLHVEDEHHTIFEDRLASVLQIVRRFEPTVVVACLDATSFEILRYVPSSVLRIGMVQSDDPVVYEMVARYAGYMDGIAGVSTAIVRKLEAMEVFRPVSRYYLPYGVAMPAQISQRAQPGEPLRILYLGRVAHEQKRVDLFPRIMDALRAAGIPFQWTIAGDGPDRATLESQMQPGTEDQRVVFKGAIPYGEVSRMVDLHDIFILTSDYEGLPLSLLEAMGHGLVPVVSDLSSGIREVVDQSNGVLVAVDEVEGYARGIIFLHEDRAALKAKTLAARARVRAEYSVEAMTDRWQAVLGEVRVDRVEWPDHRSVHGVLTDPQKWKYTWPFRWLRRRFRRFRHRAA